MFRRRKHQIPKFKVFRDKDGNIKIKKMKE